MGTWAAVTRLDAPEVAPLVQKLGSSNISVAVVDTNAIISGLQLHRIADTAVTIPEVLSEVRDKHTRQALANVPFALECQQPTEESVKAGTGLALTLRKQRPWDKMQDTHSEALDCKQPHTDVLSPHSALQFSALLGLQGIFTLYPQLTSGS